MKLIQPIGIFDGRQGREIHNQIGKFIDTGVKIFLLDFQSVNFMDSSGFGALLLMLKTVQKDQGRLVICSINEQIRMILELSDTTKIFEVLPDQDTFMKNLTLA
ncbi:STAS domain-containing protein [Nostoc sp.]|uniref:STAS domain-containing protein n=1 Tax=Nostoc sp. TaxID=1180 RepID=UPI002FF6CA1D